MLNKNDFRENQLIEIYIIYSFVQIRLFPIFHIFYPNCIKFNTRDFHEIIIPIIVIFVKIGATRNFQFLRKPYTVSWHSLHQITEHWNRISHCCPKVKPQNAILNFKIIFIFIQMNQITLTRRSAEASLKNVNILRPVNPFVCCAWNELKVIYFSGIEENLFKVKENFSVQWWW
jgi:hypothetical protein